jgi:hypothetical protein
VGDPELDQLLARFGSGDRTWELGARLASVLAAAGRAAQIPPILAQCRPLQLESIGAERVASFDDPRLGFTGWRLPPALGRSAILDLGSQGAHEVRLGDRFLVEFGGGMGAAAGMCGVGFTLVRSMGEPVAGREVNIDTQASDESPESLRASLSSALEKFAAAIGATVVQE